MDSTKEHVLSPRDERENLLAGLLLQTAAGDQEAFSEFYRRTSRQVTALVLRVVIDRELGEEVVQEVFLVVWQDAGKYRQTLGTPTAWLMTIAHRRAVDTVRSNQSSRNRDDRWARTASLTYDGVLQSVTDKMDARMLVASLSCLSALQRESIVLAYFGCLTYREIADRLSVPLPTIKSRIRDGVQRLRAHLDPA